MNTSINQDANAIANLQRHEIPSKNPEDILNIKTSLQNKIGSIVKKTLYTVTQSVVWESYCSLAGTMKN